MHSYGGLLEPRGSKLTPLKSTFNAEHFVCRLSWYVLNGFSAICVSQPKIANKSLKHPLLGVQGHSRSSMLVPPESSSEVLVMISCDRFHARGANSGKITISKGDTPL